MRLRSRPRLAATLLSLGSLYLALVAGELVLRQAKVPGYRELQPMREREARRTGHGFDSRTALDVLEDFRSEGLEAYPPLKPINFLDRPLVVEGRELVPLAGIRRVRTVFNANETGERLVYESDEYGFHNPPGLHRKGVAEIVLIGDSFAQGVAVRSEESVASRLREHVPGTLSLGMGASGPLAELAILLEYARPLEPATVLWLYYEANDISDAASEARSEILRAYLEEAPQPSLRRDVEAIDAALREVAERLIVDYKALLEKEPEGQNRVAQLLALAEVRRRIGDLGGSGGLAGSDARRRSAARGYDLFRQSIRRAREAVEGWGGSLFFVYLPEFARFSERWPLSPDSLRRAEVLDFLRQENVPVIDLVPAFEARPDPVELFPFALPGHYDPEGYALVADTIRAELTRRGRAGSGPELRSSPQSR